MNEATRWREYVLASLQVYQRRGESLKKILSFQGMQDTMRAFLPPFPYSNIVSDYVESCRLQDPPDHKIFHEALVLAVDQG